MAHSVFLDTFTAEDRAKLAAYALEQAERCNLCGTAGWEWQEDPLAYEAVTKICLGCQNRDLARDVDKRPGSSVVLIPPAQAQKLREAEAAARDQEVRSMVERRKEAWGLK
jgi:hypothetical protein